VKRIDVTYVLILNESEDKVLMVRNADNDLWTLPGGAVEPGETLVQAAIREASEETGVSIEVGPLVSVNECTLTQYGEHALFFTFRARLMDGEPHVVRPREILSVQWMDFNTANGYLTYHPGGIESLLQANCPYIDEGIK
jgi:8-oxo-dGTP diphosphatase